MTAHSLIVMFPVPLLVAALALDLVDLRRSGAATGGAARGIVGGALAVVGLAAFTGLGARRSLPSAIPGLPMPWDVHVTWAVVLLFPIVGLGMIRIRASGASSPNAPFRSVLLDLALLLLVCAATLTGLRVP